MKVGVALPISEDAERGVTPGYAQVRAMARQAEAAGLDSIWLFDHFFIKRPDQPMRGQWEIWTILSGLAEATERVELGTLVMCVPFRNPAVLAKMADTLEEVSAGRLILGLGAGWHQPEFDAFGVPFDHLASRFEESLQIIGPLLREGKVDFQGTYYGAPNCELRPRGPRPAGPPILIGSSKPRMLRLTAQYADAWNTCWLGDVAALAEPRAKMDAACREVGRDPRTLEVTVGVSVSYRETPPDPLKALSGSPVEIAAGLQGHAAAGVGHVICALSPNTPESLARFVEAHQAYRQKG
jgi:alkanesulfonate monooxygenase SsuD/methylene tetrahydromethanopterin reductase-like flavin-dependent oxidoreductase (luciferase family)